MIWPAGPKKTAPSRKALTPRPSAAASAALPASPMIEDGDERMMAPRFARLKKLITAQTYAIAALAVVLAITLPLAQPIYLYYALRPDKTVMHMMGLAIPNMTNRAIIAWTTTSVTEIMTMGFGDIDVKLPKQKWRFTAQGWDAYTTAFVHANMDQKFKEDQLVLTTVPSDTPVITGQGVNPDGAYQWNLQMPIIMTYATNNNQTRRQKHILSLSVVRVPAEDDAFGIAIQSWNLIQ